MNYIYKITNKINNKIYIGKTTILPEIRWKQHISASNGNKNRIDYNYLLHKAIRKYGKDNFILEILEEVEDESLLSKKEIYYINYYNSCILKENSNGYNMTFGGEGYNIIDKQKLIELWKQGKGSQEISKILNHNIDQIKKLLKTFEEYDKNLDEARNRSNRKVYQYDQNGILIQEFPSISYAAKQLKIDSSNISKCCYKEKNSCAGFFWSYSNNEYFEPQKLYRQKKVKIIQKDLNDNIIQIFPTMTAACKAMGIKNGQLIKKCCNNEREQAYGYKWSLADRLACKGADELK